MLKSIALIIISIAIAAAGQLCLKAGMNEVGRITSEAFTSPFGTFVRVARVPMVWLGLFLYGLSAVSWMTVLSRVDLSFAYPMVGFSYVVVLLFSALLLGEQVSPLRWLGTLIIVAGIVLITRT
jgi:drug/metabolite transporter (DMT)-like permease